MNWRIWRHSLCLWCIHGFIRMLLMHLSCRIIIRASYKSRFLLAEPGNSLIECISMLLLSMWWMASRVILWPSCYRNFCSSVSSGWSKWLLSKGMSRMLSKCLLQANRHLNVPYMSYLAWSPRMHLHQSRDDIEKKNEPWEACTDVPFDHKTSLSTSQCAINPY